jgi:hypothetical protein
MATDAHFGGPPRIPVRTSDRLLGAARGNPEGKEGPPHHVIGGQFSRRAGATRLEAAVGLASPPHVRTKTPPSHPQVRSIDSAIKHFGAPAAAAPPVAAAAAPPVAAAATTGTLLQALPTPWPEAEQLDLAIPLPCDAVVVEAAVVRDGAPLSAKHVGDLQPGESVVVVEEQLVDGHQRVRLQDERWGGTGWVSRTTNIGRDLLRGPWAASVPSAAPAGPDALPSSLTTSELASALGDVRRKLARWASALPTGAEHDRLAPDVARRRRKADIAEAMRGGKGLLRRGRGAVEVLEGLGPTAPPELSEAVQQLSTQVGSDVVRELIHTGRIDLASQWAAAVASWLGAVAALAPPLAAICVDSANTIACLCLSRSNLPHDADSSMIRRLATAASQAVRHALKGLKALRAQDKVALSSAPGMHPTAALAARCHLNGCAADGRIGRHRPALEHATRARKAASVALADAGTKEAAAAATGSARQKDSGGGGGGGSAVAAELLVLAWHATGAQHESLDEPGFCLAAYEKAYAVCKKHSTTVGSSLMESVRSDRESAQRRFEKNRAVTALEIKRGIEAELGGGGPPPKQPPPQQQQRRGQNGGGAGPPRPDVATGEVREEMQSSMFTGIHKKKNQKKKKQAAVEDRPAWDARPAALASASALGGPAGGGGGGKEAKVKLRLPVLAAATEENANASANRDPAAAAAAGQGRRRKKVRGGERKGDTKAKARELRGKRGEKAVVIRAAEGSLALPPIRVC